MQTNQSFAKLFQEDKIMFFILLLMVTLLSLNVNGIYDSNK